MRIILLLPDPTGVEERAVHTWLHQQSGPRAGVHPLHGCEGAVLVVDSTQGIEAQTLANLFLALDAGLEIIPPDQFFH